MNGDEMGELKFENFNAASVKIIFKGRNVHSEYAEHKMINSIRVASRFMSMLPSHETSEHTERYEGFYHLIDIIGEVEKITVIYIIRDHDRSRLKSRKKESEHLVCKINAGYGEGAAVLELHDQRHSICEKIGLAAHIIDTAFKAMEAAGVEPCIRAIRGGTDGAQLSFKELLCPNIFVGDLNFHGRYELAPVQSMEKTMRVTVRVAEFAAVDR